MSETGTQTDPVAIRDEWIAKLTNLVMEMESWARADGWAVTRIEKQMADSGIGPYKAPAQVFQKAFTRLLLDPISREFPGAEGVVDLYKMPALDDVASIYSQGEKWLINHIPLDQGSVARVQEGESLPLTPDSFARVVGGMIAADGT